MNLPPALLEHVESDEDLQRIIERAEVVVAPQQQVRGSVNEAEVVPVAQEDEQPEDEAKEQPEEEEANENNPPHDNEAEVVPSGQEADNGEEDHDYTRDINPSDNIKNPGDDEVDITGHDSDQEDLCNDQPNEEDLAMENHADNDQCPNPDLDIQLQRRTQWCTLRFGYPNTPMTSQNKRDFIIRERFSRLGQSKYGLSPRIGKKNKNHPNWDTINIWMDRDPIQVQII
jgi:hypothetical protein